VKVKSKSELLFRKAFIPWYDTEPAMLLTLAFAVGTLLFGINGVAAALESPQYRAYVWVPGLLAILSSALTVSTLVRLIRRR
jgi:hypothetical protein